MTATYHSNAVSKPKNLLPSVTVCFMMPVSAVVPLCELMRQSDGVFDREVWWLGSSSAMPVMT
jgi:hypothetical protein